MLLCCDKNIFAMEGNKESVDTPCCFMPSVIETNVEQCTKTNPVLTQIGYSKNKYAYLYGDNINEQVHFIVKKIFQKEGKNIFFGPLPGKKVTDNFIQTNKGGSVGMGLIFSYLGQEQYPNAIVFASGGVDETGSLVPIDGLYEKGRCMIEYMKQYSSQYKKGKRFFFVLPWKNKEEWCIYESFFKSKVSLYDLNINCLFPKNSFELRAMIVEKELCSQSKNDEVSNIFASYKVPLIDNDSKIKEKDDMKEVLIFLADCLTSPKLFEYSLREVRCLFLKHFRNYYQLYDIDFNEEKDEMKDMVIAFFQTLFFMLSKFEFECTIKDLVKESISSLNNEKVRKSFIAIAKKLLERNKKKEDFESMESDEYIKKNWNSFFENNLVRIIQEECENGRWKAKLNLLPWRDDLAELCGIKDETLDVVEVKDLEKFSMLLEKEKSYCQECKKTNDIRESVWKCVKDRKKKEIEEIIKPYVDMFEKLYLHYDENKTFKYIIQVINKAINNKNDDLYRILEEVFMRNENNNDVYLFVAVMYYMLFVFKKNEDYLVLQPIVRFWKDFIGKKKPSKILIINFLSFLNEKLTLNKFNTELMQGLCFDAALFDEESGLLLYFDWLCTYEDAVFHWIKYGNSLSLFFLHQCSPFIKKYIQQTLFVFYSEVKDDKTKIILSKKIANLFFEFPITLQKKLYDVWVTDKKKNMCILVSLSEHLNSKISSFLGSHFQEGEIKWLQDLNSDLENNVEKKQN